MVDKLPAEAVTAPVESSFPNILATLQHLYQGDKYDLIHLQGGSVGMDEITPPATYAELRQEWPRLHAELLTWAKENLAARKDVMLTGWAIPRLAWMVVMQIANHATHHLGQVVTLARQAGYRPERSDFTDLIGYYLQRYPQQQAGAI